MDRILTTPRQVLREHAERLQRAERSRRVLEISQRMRIRGWLRKAILETVRLNGSTRELAEELNGLVRKSERRFSGRPCC